MTPPAESLKRRILAATGETPADLVLRGGQVVNLFSGKTEEGDVAVCEGFVVGVGPGYRGREEVDLKGRWIAPGLMDGHIHIESSMLLPSRLAAALLVHGTTTLVSDPHEIANVMGLDGVLFMVEEGSHIPMDIFYMAPSCVPATHLETSGAHLDASRLAELKGHPRILGLAEMMNYPAVLSGDPLVLEKLSLFADQVLDGHGPSLTGRALQAYAAAGIRSDHETTMRPEGREKLDHGMTLMIREGSSAQNLEALLPLVRDEGYDRVCFVSDDLHAEEIAGRGHLDFILKKAVRLGLDPITAVRLVTLNPAVYFGLRDRGAVAPGFRADLVVLEDLRTFRVLSVYKDGRHVVQEGELQVSIPDRGISSRVRAASLNMAPLTPDHFRIAHPGGKARVIEIVPGQILTRSHTMEIRREGGDAVPHVEQDILKLAVIERHRASGRLGLGFVQGFGLREGAMASSVAHDSHNVIALGATDEEMFRAVEEVRVMGGGLSVVRGRETLARTPLEIAGLMSIETLDALIEQLAATNGAAARLGCALDQPFMTLSFLALPVIPELKLTDRGLVDVERFEIVPLFPESG
jgi:adenine deaminase